MCLLFYRLYNIGKCELNVPLHMEQYVIWQGPHIYFLQMHTRPRSQENKFESIPNLFNLGLLSMFHHLFIWLSEPQHSSAFFSLTYRAKATDL